MRRFCLGLSFISLTYSCSLFPQYLSRAQAQAPAATQAPALSVTDFAPKPISPTPAKSPTQGDFDWDLVKKRMLVGEGGKDYIPDGGKGKPIHFTSFSYYAPDVEPSYKTERLGLLLSRQGEPDYIELEKEPGIYSAWYVTTGVGLEGFADLDGDGHDEFVLSTYGRDAGYLRVFKTFPKLELVQSYDGPGMLFSLVQIDTGEAAPKMCIVGSGTGARDGTVNMLRLQCGTAVLEPSERSQYEWDDLNWARRSAQAWRLGHSYDIDEALKSIEYYLNRKPDDAPLLATRAALLAARTMYEGGAKRKEDVTTAGLCVDRALAAEPTNGWALGVKGYLLTSNGKSKESIEYFDKAIASQPKNPEWYAQRALANEDLGEYEKARDDYSKQIELDSQNNWAYASRAHTDFYLNDMEATVADADKALAIKSDDCFALKQRGRGYGNLGQDDKALPDLEAAARLEPNDPENFAVLGMCYMRLKMSDKAKDAYHRMLKLDPGNAEAKKALADIDSEMKKSATK